MLTYVIKLAHTGVPLSQVQITNVNYQYGCSSFNTTLSWVAPNSHRIDYYQIRIGHQLQTAPVLVRIDSSDVSFTTGSLPYFEPITVGVAIVNCAGAGAELNFTVAKGIAINIH